MTGLLRRLRERHENGDAGITLIEMVVGMVVMGIFMSIFTGAVISMYRSTDKAQAINNSSAQLNIAFSRLDHEIRYVSYLGAPAVGADGNWYVVAQTTNTGTAVCTQLRVNQTSSTLQQRTWNAPGDGTYNNLSGWTSLASSITNGNAASGSASQPFVRALATSTLTSEELTITLVSTSGTGSLTTTSTSSVTFVAVNTDLNTATSGKCGEVTST